MSQVADLKPPQDAGLEKEVVGFDFGAIMQAGETILPVGGVTLTCTAVVGTDANAQNRFIGFPSIVPSDSTGAPMAQVNILFGLLVAGVKYKLQCNVVTNLQELNLWTHMSAVAPS